jgi:2-dehydro-3-deoxyglucarate aldolase/4-hydroxy-2-oxoheptanedioate aldolase
MTDYEAVSVPDVVSWVNEHTLVIVQVESAEALAQLEQTARVPGIDVAVIGPNDLSISLGIPGDFEHPRFLEAVEHTFEICLKNGISPGVHTSNLQAVKRYRDMGMGFLMYSTEARMLLDAATKAVHELVGETAKVGKAVY